MADVITAQHFDDNDNAETFKIRSTVKAVRCPNGASVVDDDGKVAHTYAGPCYVVEGDDGDHRIVSAYVFDGIYDTSGVDDTSDESTAADTGARTENPPAVPAATTTPPQPSALPTGDGTTTPPATPHPATTTSASGKPRKGSQGRGKPRR